MSVNHGIFKKHILPGVLSGCVALVIAGPLLVAQSGKIESKDKKAAAAIEAAKKALGGENIIDGIKSLLLTGTITTGASKENFEIKILLPDNYIKYRKMQDDAYDARRNERNDLLRSHGINATSRVLGISNGELIEERTTVDGIKTYHKYNIDNMPYANRTLDELARLLLGTILKTDSKAPLTVSSLQGASNKFSVVTARGLLCEIEFDSKHKYPSVITYKDETLPGRQVVVRFKDREAIDGVMFPKTMVEEYEFNNKAGQTKWEFDKVLINPKLDINDF